MACKEKALNYLKSYMPIFLVSLQGCFALHSSSTQDKEYAE
jgi:hypothetical protein